VRRQRPRRSSADVVLSSARGGDLEEADRVIGPLTENRPLRTRMSAAALSADARRSVFLFDDTVGRFLMTMLPSRMPRPEWAPPPDRYQVGVAAISRTLSMGTPSHSFTSWAKVVSCPWPCETIPSPGRRNRRPTVIFRPLARDAGRGVDVVADPMPRHLPPRTRRGAARRKTIPIAERERRVHDPMIGTAVVDHAEGFR